MKREVKRVNSRKVYSCISWLVVLICAALLLWILLSVIEIQAHNFTMVSDAPHQYGSWNFFFKIFKGFNVK